jgi:hypothetical protein
MKLMDISWRVRSRLRLFATASVLGIMVGVFVLFPINEFVYYSEYQEIGRPAIRFAASQLQQAFRGNMPEKVAFYTIVGVMLSLGGAAISVSMTRRADQVRQLSAALDDDLRGTIARGESASLEFKSTFRWDLREGCINRSLETVVLKTLAGYLNSKGGTLLIGVADNGNIIGLDSDYSTLKKPDRDGFEQVFMTSIASKLGGDACQCVQAVFHSIEDQDICRVMVSPAHRPVYVRDGETPKLYVRTGVSTRELNVQEAINYNATRWKK